jgi:hypothetical protein
MILGVTPSTSSFLAKMALLKSTSTVSSKEADRRGPESPRLIPCLEMAIKLPRKHIVSQSTAKWR